MTDRRVKHFDAFALLAEVRQQPIGLIVSSNHPTGFRRILYLHMRRNPTERCHILQSPSSANAFYIVRGDYNMPTAVTEEQPDGRG